MRKTYIGIDVGAKGYIATVDSDGTWNHLSLMNTPNATVCDFLRSISANNNVSCVIEDVHALYGSSASATFSFGEAKGFLVGVLTALSIPFTPVTPRQWQSCVWTNFDKVKDGKRINTKKTSINAACRLFPELDFRRNGNCRNLDDNKVDATLMAEYARRNNL
jgi:hypothetical protein